MANSGPDKVERLFRQYLTDSWDYALVAIDSENRIIEWNAGAQNTYGYRREEIVGQPASTLFAPRQSNSDTEVDPLQKARDSGRTEADGWHMRKGGGRFFASATISRVFQKGDEFLLMVARDFTNPMRVREQAARAEMESAMRMKDLFISTLSHELRTPLTAIMLWSRILRGEAIDEQTRLEAINTIDRSASAQAEMIEDLLDSSRLMSGRLRLNRRQLQLGPIIQQAVDAAAAGAKSRGITLEADFDPDCCRVNADPVRIQQAAANMLMSTINAASNGAVVSIAIKSLENGARIQMIDSNQAGAAKKVEEISEASGVRLTVARRLVELHGGTFHVQSNQGGATTITAELHSSPATDTPEPMSPAFARSDLLGGVRILLIDDEADARTVVSWILEQSGAEVTAVESASKAMEVIENSGPKLADVILCDIGMVGEDGYDFIRKFRAIDPRRSTNSLTPAVAVTGYVGDENRRRALRSGYQAFVPKPIDPDELVSLLGDLTGRNVAVSESDSK